jgi:hypothetical protein
VYAKAGLLALAKDGDLVRLSADKASSQP